jgi:hypothetical protein
MDHGGAHAPRYAVNDPGFHSHLDKGASGSHPQTVQTIAPRKVALAKTPLVRRAKVGDKWYPIDSDGNVQNAPPMKAGGRFLGGGAAHGQLGQGDLNALASAFDPRNLERMRQETIQREQGSNPIGRFIRGAGHVAGEAGHVASLALGVPEMKTAAHEIANWHISNADKARYQRQQDVSQAVDKAVLEGMAPQTVMAAVHGHTPTAGDFLWDLTLFGGPTLKLLRGARGAKLGADAVEAVARAKQAERAARAERAAGRVAYRHPNEAWLESSAEKQAARRARRTRGATDAYR